MKIVFRADASLQIGTGHVMRCLTLADALEKRGAQSVFICREHSGNLIEYIRCKGYVVYVLPYLSEIDTVSGKNGCDYLLHASWLGATCRQDAEGCLPILQTLKPEWLIVDHYALDVQWEAEVKSSCRRLMVIDDLADRRHDCHVLLDQNLGRTENDYIEVVSPECQLLVGPAYALLRPEFSAFREYSLARRVHPQLAQLLITMGGVDAANVTGQVLDAVVRSALPADCSITVVMGPRAPHLDLVQAQVRRMPWPTQVCANVDDMAQKMADSDLCIGAAGSTSWERCCLGVPTIMIVQAANQQFIANSLDRVSAADLANSPDADIPRIIDAYRVDTSRLAKMSRSAAKIVDGHGVARIALHLMG